MNSDVEKTAIIQQQKIKLITAVTPISFWNTMQTIWYIIQKLKTIPIKVTVREDEDKCQPCL